MLALHPAQSSPSGPPQTSDRSTPGTGEEVTHVAQLVAALARTSRDNSSRPCRAPAPKAEEQLSPPHGAARGAHVAFGQPTQQSGLARARAVCNPVTRIPPLRDLSPD